VTDAPDDDAATSAPPAPPALTAAQLTAQLEAVVAGDPHNAEALSVVDTILRSVPSPRALAPLDEIVSVERAALHARALLVEGATVDAMLLLADIAALDPAFPALAWLEKTALETLPATVRPRFLEALSAIVRADPSSYPNTDSQVKNERDLAAVLGRLPDDRARFLRAEVLRRAGLMHEARALTEGATDPEAKRTHHLASGAILLDEGSFVAASAAFAAVDDDEAASLGRVIAEAMASPDDAFAEALDALRERLREARDRGGNANANAAAAFLLRLEETPFFHVIPYPYDEATAQLRALLPTLPKDAPWSLQWSGHAPAPTVELAIALAAGRAGTTVTFDHGAVVGPARAPRRTPPAPTSAGIYDALLTLATSDGDGHALFAAAKEVAQTLTWEQAPEWAATTAHLPVPPTRGRRSGTASEARNEEDENPHEVDVFVWVQRCQLAALSVIAQVDDGWQGSLRRVLLAGFLDGRNPAAPAAGDWTTGLAAVVAARVVVDDVAGSLEVATWIRERESVTPPGSWSRFALCCAGLALRAGTTRDDRARWWREQSLWLRLVASAALPEPAAAPKPAPSPHEGPGPNEAASSLAGQASK
jgi:hypothetical protein